MKTNFIQYFEGYFLIKIGIFFFLFFYKYIDLQLAAELGKNLLARNKALEYTVKEQQLLLGEKDLEIEVSTKM